MIKVRLDQLLVSRDLVASRNQAYAAIITGEVRVNGEINVKPATLVEETAVIDYQSSDIAFVSRGGQKLEKALDYFNLDVRELIVLDAGVSTGGFTDCLLRRGATKVVAVDVGYGQIAWKLRGDDRVELHERVNLRYLAPEDISTLVDMATLDLSFISLTKVIQAVSRCLKETGIIVALAKPQFEAGKGKVPRTGVVKEPRMHIEVLVGLASRFIQDGLSLIDMTWSPIVGAKGNIEFWLYLSKKPSVGYPIKGIDDLAADVVADAHKELRPEDAGQIRKKR